LKAQGVFHFTHWQDFSINFSRSI